MITLENVSLNYPISNKNLSLRRSIVNGIFLVQILKIRLYRSLKKYKSKI